MMWLMCLLCIVKTVIICSSSVNSQENSASYTSRESRHSKTISNHIWLDRELNLTHLTLDRINGRLFVGGVNRLYQLSTDLDIEAVVVTGPQKDSTDCRAHKCRTPDTVRRLTDNHNKVLLIDYSTSRIITCGSLFQGACTVRNLGNVSIIEEEVQDVAVAANNGIASTVAFIASGPLFRSAIRDVMYVGVTYTGNSPYRNEIPAVSSRSLEKGKMFQIATKTDTIGTFMFFNSDARESYVVDYIYGFSSEGFSYFLTIQLKHIDNKHSMQKEYITKLVRICQKDSHYHSYTEVPLNCNAQNGTKYNLVRAAYFGKAGASLAESLGITPEDDVLYAVFSEGERRDVPTNRSALCIYPLKEIRRMFWHNIKTCFNGIGDRGLDFISANMPCVAMKSQTISEDFCGFNVNSPLDGTEPIEATATMLMPHHLTAVAATSTSGYTVLSFGTQTGHLKKVLVESVTSAVEYAEIVIDEGSKINSIQIYDEAELNLYVMTARSVAKVSLLDCAALETCVDCLKAKDPYCGWCFSEAKCSLRSNCHDDINYPSVWVDPISGKCPTIMNVWPHQLQRSTVRMLELQIDRLPAITEELFCVFTITDSGWNFAISAARKSYGVMCRTPPTNLLPQFSQEIHFFTTELSVKAKADKGLAFTNFTFFDCSTYMTCTECVSTQFPCIWCIGKHICTHDASTVDNCQDGISGPDFCPQINAAGNDSEILIAFGTTKSIEVKFNLPQGFNSRFECQFDMEGIDTIIGAQLSADTIYCDKMEFAYYTSKLPSLTVIFTVLWNGNKPLENPHNVHVVIYRCNHMADSCGTCLLLPEKYVCGWCQSTSTCEINDQCSKHMERKKNWLNREQTCPDPTIHSFRPIVGPISGGTQVSIIGKYLDTGSRIEAFIGERPCEILSFNHTQALCRTSPANSQNIGKLKMTFDNIVREFNGDPFRYVKDPTIDYVGSGPSGQWKSPKGIPAGGIKITVIGNQFKAIQQPTMYVYYEGKMYHSECNVVSNTKMNCYSPSIDDPSIMAQLMNITPDRPIYLEYGFAMDDVVEVQNISKKGNHRPFELHPNPVYLKFDGNVKYGESEYLTINGRNLDSACRECDIVVMVGDKTCNITSLSREKLTCRPPIEPSDGNQTPTVRVTVGKALIYEVGVLSYASPNLIMDGLAGIIAFVLITVLMSFLFYYVRNRCSHVQDNSEQHTSAMCVSNPSYGNQTSGTSPSLPNDTNTNTGRGKRYERPLSYDEHIYAEIEETFEEEEYDKLNFAPCKSQGVSYNIPAQKNKNISLEPCT